MAEAYTISITESGFECSMDGYVAAVEEIIESLLFLVTMVLQLLFYVLPPEIAVSCCYGYMFLIAAPSFLGYLMAAAYYAGMEYGFGETMCSVSGMAYGYADYIYMAIDMVEGLVPGGLTGEEADADDICAGLLDTEEVS